MRPELELTELIEKYLRNELSPAEKEEFEKRLEADAKLQEEVRLQKEVMKGVERAALKQKAKQAYSKYNLGKNLVNWGLGALAIIIVAATVYYFIGKSGNALENGEQPLPELNENGEKLWADADKYLPLQKFILDPTKDTVIETNGGIVMAVPANCFLDANGQPVSGEIELEVKEALNAAPIMQGGLSTTSGDKLLETGGMFYLNARQDDNSLKIDPSKGVYAEVPTQEVKPGMMLFEGKRMPDGSIDWVNPKPLEKDLLAVDILSLNFYPPDYLDSLEAMGKNVKDKEYTDSLYYSFAWKEYTADEKVDELNRRRFRAIQDSINITRELIAIETGMEPVYDTTFIAPSRYNPSEEEHRLGINPAKVKAIWDKQFQGTLLSTREFEERMEWIHRTCSPLILELYINNLDNKLCAIDSMAAVYASGFEIAAEQFYTDPYWKSQRSPEANKFLEFAARGDGRVKGDVPHLKKLKAYYEARSKAFSEAVSKTQEEFWNKQHQMNVKAEEKRSEQIFKDMQRQGQNFAEELEMNMEEAYRQIGAKRIPPPATYPVNITTTGWKNLDYYVSESTINRTTLDYTDPVTGKKAVIKYEQLTVNVKDASTYDRVYVYLLPGKLSSFMRVQQQEGKYKEKLNELMEYRLVCMAWKDNNTYYYSIEQVKPQEYDVALAQVDSSTLLNTMNELSRNIKGVSLYEEVAYQKFEVKEVKRQQQVNDIVALRDRIKPVVFPCMSSITDTTTSGTPAGGDIKAQ
jgi:hypothetical protein